MRAKTKTLKSDKTNTDVPLADQPFLLGKLLFLNISLYSNDHAPNDMEVVPTSRDCLHKAREAYHVDRMKRQKTKGINENNLIYHCTLILYLPASGIPYLQLS